VTHAVDGAFGLLESQKGGYDVYVVDRMMPRLDGVGMVETVRKVVNLHAVDGRSVDLSTEPCPVLQADHDQIVQVVTNLVQNALDAVAGVPQPRVTVALRPDASANVVLVVGDNGPGVAPEMVDRLFEPYATNKPHGTGLGLAIVQRIVAEHGGEIGYAPAPGGGARFTVTLPLAGPALLPEPPTSTPLGTPGRERNE
jgi:signal transduction histidine kinase